MFLFIGLSVWIKLRSIIAGFYKINECFPYIHPNIKRGSTLKLIDGLNYRNISNIIYTLYC